MKNKRPIKKVNKQITILCKRQGTKKQCKKAMQKNRCRAFVSLNLSTRTHKSCKDYNRLQIKKELRTEIGAVVLK